ncbi:hypothetical protein [Bacillus sp. 165]|uniref:hypothetical protein n=1 Tax=Bacillus sp. 165 TaxID=1529117 RepID=UPI001ADB4AB1|nr:hypothetical protein [Bacillus sp. 165]MBO9128648.1 hypothetical protein [Bacillus sp. 165]
MIDYLIDLVIVAVLVIGITATVGVITNSIGENLFGGKKKTKFIDKSERMQSGWNNVGGKGIYKKKTY